MRSTLITRNGVLLFLVSLIIAAFVGGFGSGGGP
jgi:hypothetical protein